ncbi:MAG: GldG family protein [Phycisphaerae bacterium]|nr:GldG family protein [Phycisphaerae bacterium]
MHRSGKRTAALVAIVAVIVGVVALNTVLAFALRNLRLDLTQERLYSVSPGVKDLVRKLDETVRIDLYWSDSVGNDLPQYRMLATRVREFLDEVATASDGKVVVRQIDPKPFSEEEDVARASGLAVRPVDGAGGTLTLGLLIRGPTDRTEVMATIGPDDEPFLEYELARRIVSVERASKPVVAVLSTIPESRGGDPRDPQAAGATPILFQQLRTLFDLRFVNVPKDGAPTVPADAKLLMIIQPRGWSEATLRAIDEWVVAGKPLLALLDPWCESDPSARTQGFGGGATGTAFELGTLLASWGLEMPQDPQGGASTMVVGDRTFATRVRARGSSGQALELDYLPWLSLRESALAKNDPVTGTLAQLNVMSAGSLRKTENATTAVEPLLSSSPESQLIPTMKLGFFGQPDQLIKDFVSLGTPQFLAVRVTGPVTSAFPPASVDGSPAAAATGVVNLIIVADVDFLEDRAWVQENRFGGQSLGYTAFADNSSFVLNAIETLTGDRVLSDLRGRGQYRRPFGRVEDLRKTAEANFLAEEQVLQTRIRDSQQRINQLQQEKGAGAPGGAAGSLVLSPEQQAELTKLNATVVDSRKSLRGVQHKLRDDVERLGRSLMLLNVVAWPILVALLASFWTVGRARRQHRAKGGA